VQTEEGLLASSASTDDEEIKKNMVSSNRMPSLR